MLGKVFKYDMKALARLFFPLYIVLLALTVTNKILLELNLSSSNLNFFKMIQIIFMVMYIIMVMATGVMTLVFIIMNFYKSFLTDKAYLTFTLPVKSETHINSKMFSGALWFIISVFVIMISVIIMIVDQISFSVVFDTIGAFFNSVMKEKGAGLIILQVIVLAVVGLFDSILVFFAAMSIGQLMTKHKILGSVLAYIGIYFVGQIINTIILITIGSRGNMGTLDVVMSTTDATVTTQVMLLFVIIAQIVYGVVYYAVTYYFLSRRLNLE